MRTGDGLVLVAGGGRGSRSSSCSSKEARKGSADPVARRQPSKTQGEAEGWRPWGFLPEKREGDVRERSTGRKGDTGEERSGMRPAA